VQKYVADKLRALKIREAKAWMVIDQYMADRKDNKIPAHVRLEAAVFVLKRLYPEETKMKVGGDPDNLTPLHVYLPQVLDGVK